MREIQTLIDYWKRQEELAIEKRKTETFMDATGFACGPGVEVDSKGYPVHFGTATDSARGAYITWRRELEKYRDLFDSFRTHIDEYLTEEAIAAAEKFYLDSISHHTAWGIPERDWLITMERGCEIKFELIRHRQVTLSVTFGRNHCSVHYMEWKNLKDVAWRLTTKEKYGSGKVHPTVANHMVRRAVLYSNNSTSEPKWHYSMTRFYDGCRARCKEAGVPYNPWRS